MQQFKLGARASVPGLDARPIEASRYRDGNPQHRITGIWYDEDAITLLGDDMPDADDATESLDAEYSLLVEELFIDKSSDATLNDMCRLGELIAGGVETLTLDEGTWNEIPSNLRNAMIGVFLTTQLAAHIGASVILTAAVKIGGAK